MAEAATGTVGRRRCRMCDGTTSRVIAFGATMSFVCVGCLPPALVNVNRLQDPSEAAAGTSMATFTEALSKLTTGRGVLFRVKKRGWFLVLLAPDVPCGHPPPYIETSVHEEVYTTAVCSGLNTVVPGLRHALQVALLHVGNMSCCMQHMMQ